MAAPVSDRRGPPRPGPGLKRVGLCPDAPRKESVHNRFAGRPEPMVWRPSGETRFMGWTVKTSRRRDRLRHRPHLECLDDRCLLSTGLEGPLAHVAPTLRVQHSGTMPGGHAGTPRGKGARLVVRYHGHGHPAVERPTGTMTSGPATT